MSTVQRVREMGHRLRRVRLAGVLLVVGLLAVLGASLLAGSASSRARRQAPATAAPPPPAVVVTPAITATVPVYEEAVAQTVALQTVTLRAQIAGTLEQMLFKEGTSVKRGQTLFVIDQRPYMAALESAQAQLANARAALQQALQQVQLRQAQAQVKRDGYLVAQGAIAQQQLDNDTAAMKSPAANVEAQQAVVKDTALSNTWPFVAMNPRPSKGGMTNLSVNR